MCDIMMILACVAPVGQHVMQPHRQLRAAKLFRCCFLDDVVSRGARSALQLSARMVPSGTHASSRHSSERWGASCAEATADDASQPLLGVCGICHDPLEDGIPAACGHSFCRVCVTEYLDNSVGATACPSCQRPLTIDLTAPSTTAAAAADTAGSPGGGANGAAAEKFKKRSIMNRINTRAFQSSTKLEALNEAIQRMLAADPSAKCIVFSQFTSMLDLAQYRLQQVRAPPSRLVVLNRRMRAAFGHRPGRPSLRNVLVW